MNEVFADTHYWIAVTRPSDPYRKAALRARNALGDVVITTTDEVLCEFLTALSNGGSHLRRAGVAMVNEIMRNENVKVVAQCRDSFVDGMERYANRLDKQYSLPDCVSMNVMEKSGIRRVLTHDHHFKQEGFEILIQNGKL